MTLFPDYEPEVRQLRPSEQPGLSADRRRTLRQAEKIVDGIHPLTGGPLHELASRHRDSSAPKDDPFTCGSCYFRNGLDYHNKSYAKCVLGASTDRPAPYITHSASTDVRAWWPACRDYSPSGRMSDDAARYIPPDDERDAKQARVEQMRAADRAVRAEQTTDEGIAS